MRNIAAYKRSTPTYVYNVTGADVSGIDIDTLAIGMTIKWTTFTAYILPKLDANSMFNIVESATVKAYQSDTYCRHEAGTNTFIITLPLWRLPTTLTGEAVYQIFLFNKSQYSEVVTDGAMIIVPATIQATNVVIDNGGFELLDSYVPPIIGETASGSTPSTPPAGRPEIPPAGRPEIRVF